MSNGALVASIVVGAALVAFWLDVRLGERMPRTWRRVALHVTGGVLATSLIPLPMILLATNTSPARAIVGLFAFVLPAFVYSFLTWIWLVKLLRSAASTR